MRQDTLISGFKVFTTRDNTILKQVSCPVLFDQYRPADSGDTSLAPSIKALFEQGTEESLNERSRDKERLALCYQSAECQDSEGDRGRLVELHETKTNRDAVQRSTGTPYLRGPELNTAEITSRQDPIGFGSVGRKAFMPTPLHSHPESAARRRRIR